MLTVKYGLIKLISTKADLCEQITNVQLECPVEKGELNIEKVVSLPGEIPPVSIGYWLLALLLAFTQATQAYADKRLQGKYTVVADVYTKDDEPITCLKATVVFSMGANILNLEL
jgi:hypothetical protein